MRKNVTEGINNLASQYPEIAKEWDYEKNDIKPTEVTFGSRKKVWWLCPKGHSWEASIVYRTRQTAFCPICNKHTSFSEQAIFYYMHQKFNNVINTDRHLGKELDIYIPSKNIAIEYDGVIWHDKRLNKDIQKNKLCKDNNITLIRVREKGLPILDDCICLIRENQSDKELDNIILKILNYLDINDIDVNVSRDTGKIYSQFIFNQKENSLSITYPEIAKEWHPTKNGNIMPDMVAPKSNKKFWWLGKCGHEWQATINKRTNAHNCPYCRGYYQSTNRIGETRINNNQGLKMTIITYRNANDIDVQFEDGTIVKNKRYNTFKKGEIENPNYNLHKNRIGEINYASNGQLMEVIVYRNSHDIDIQFEDGTIVEHRFYSNFQKGKIINPNYYKNMYIGKSNTNNQGLKMTIVDYENIHDINIQFEDGYISEHKTYNNFIKGTIRNPNFNKIKVI